MPQNIAQQLHSSLFYVFDIKAENPRQKMAIPYNIWYGFLALTNVKTHHHFYHKIVIGNKFFSEQSKIEKLKSWSELNHEISAIGICEPSKVNFQNFEKVWRCYHTISDYTKKLSSEQNWLLSVQNVIKFSFKMLKRRNLKTYLGKDGISF